MNYYIYTTPNKDGSFDQIETSTPFEEIPIDLAEMTEDQCNFILGCEQFVKLTIDNQIVMSVEDNAIARGMVQQIKSEQERLNNLIPSAEEVRKAETELLVYEILIDGGLL